MNQLTIFTTYNTTKIWLGSMILGTSQRENKTGPHLQKGRRKNKEEAHGYRDS